MTFEIEELEKIKTEELLNIEDIFSDRLSNKVGEKKIRAGLVKITPEMAKKLLTNNPNNRQIKEAYVNFLAKEISEDRWVLNGEPIIVDLNGDIADGQHRLWGCIKSNKSITSLVVYGVEPSVISTIDTGTKRIAKDCLDIYNIANSSLTSSTIKLINQFYRGSYGELGSQTRVLSNQQVIDFYDDNQKKLESSINIGMNLYKKCNKLVSSSIIAGLHFLFAKKSDIQADEFFTKLCTGLGLEDGSPITALRNKLMREAVNGTKSLGQKEKVRSVIYAWNKYRNNEKCKTIKLVDDMKLTIQ